MITKDIRELNEKIDGFLEMMLKIIPQLVENQEKLQKTLDKLNKPKENK